jgi:hypothetical protein
MNNSISWDEISYIPVKDDRCFGGTYHLNLKGRVVSYAINQLEAGSKHTPASILKMGAISSSETCFVSPATPYYVPENNLV